MADAHLDDTAAPGSDELEQRLPPPPALSPQRVEHLAVAMRPHISDELAGQCSKAWQQIAAGCETISWDELNALMISMGRTLRTPSSSSLPGSFQAQLVMLAKHWDAVNFESFLDLLAVSLRDAELEKNDMKNRCGLCSSISSGLPDWEGRLECEREPGLCSVFGDAAGAQRADDRIDLADIRKGLKAVFQWQDDAGEDDSSEDDDHEEIEAKIMRMCVKTLRVAPDGLIDTFESSTHSEARVLLNNRNNQKMAARACQQALIKAYEAVVWYKTEG